MNTTQTTRFPYGVAQFTVPTPSAAAAGTITVPGIRLGKDYIIRADYLSGTAGAITGTPVDVTAYCSLTADNTITLLTGSGTATGGLIFVTFSQKKK